MKAIVLAAGLGKRMRPLTDIMPKPMVKVGGITLIDRALDWLSASGIDEAVVNTHYKAEMLERHLAPRNTPHIVFSHEETLLETGGGIKKALPLLGKMPFIGANSDTICIDGKIPAIRRLQAAWDESSLDALLLVHPTDDAVGYHGAGDFFVTNGRIKRIGNAASAPYVFTGIQLLHPRIFAGAPEGAFSLNLLYNRAIDYDGTLSRVGALIHDGGWLHVGDPAAILLAEQALS